MNKTNLKIALGLALALGACGSSSSQATSTTASASSVRELSVEEVAAGISGGTLRAFDANREETYLAGHVPGAVWVGHELNASLLPEDRGAALVFYCASQECGASHQVAEQAIAAGYTNVAVMPAGIAGWQAAGQATEAAPAAAQ